MCDGGSNGVSAANAYQNLANANAQQQTPRSEQTMVDMIREDLGVSIEAQAWRMFIRHRWSRICPLAHRIHEGKR